MRGRLRTNVTAAYQNIEHISHEELKWALHHMPSLGIALNHDALCGKACKMHLSMCIKSANFLGNSNVVCLIRYFLLCTECQGKQNRLMYCDLYAPTSS